MQCHHRSRRACRSSCYCNCSACWQARAFTPIAGKNARCPLESCCGFWSPVVVDFIGNATGIVAFRGMCVHVPMAWMRSLCNTSLPSSSLTTLLFVCASSCINVCVFCVVVLLMGLAGGLVGPGGSFQRQGDGQGESPKVPRPGRGSSAHPLRHAARVGESVMLVLLCSCRHRRCCWWLFRCSLSCCFS